MLPHPRHWTDRTAHDPGVTLLELLAYGVTDVAGLGGGRRRARDCGWRCALLAAAAATAAATAGALLLARRRRARRRGPTRGREALQRV